MKTLIALSIAIAAFGSTLAWSAEPASTPSTSAAAPAAPKAARAAAGKKTGTPSRTPAFDESLLKGPAVLCACGRSRTQA